MNVTSPTDILITHIHRLFNRDVGLVNDYLRLENRILRSKIGKRVPLNNRERRWLARYGKDEEYSNIEIRNPKQYQNV